MDDVVRDAVMLGAAAIHPIVTRRVDTTVAALMKGARLERWRRVALASSKQSRRAILPEVRTPLRFEDFLNEPSAALRLMLVEPSTSATAESIGALRDETVPHDVTVFVGPEGGWTEEEMDGGTRPRCPAGHLGQRTLRADAVPVAAISVLQFLWNDL